MKIFFLIMILIGALFIFMEWSGARTSDSMPMEFAHLGGYGMIMVAVGIFGELCAWFLP